MADSRANVLQYGHLGIATYLSNAQSWEFSRSLRRDPQLALYGSPRLYPSTSGNEQARDFAPCYELYNSKLESLLLKRIPELVPGLSLLRFHDTASKAVLSAVEPFDPLASALIAVGNATIPDSEHSERSHVPILLVVSGQSASDVKLLPIEAQAVQWPPGTTTNARTPTFSGRGVGWLVGRGCRIQQITSSEAVDDKSSFFAVRRQVSTIILRPLFQRKLVPPRYADGQFGLGNFPYSRVDANPVVEIPNSLTGGEPHADVAFNLWYQRQIAIIDRRGRWSIWDIQGRQHKAHWHADQVSSGSLLPPDAGAAGGTIERDHYDGWASILWVKDIYRLLICDRRNIALCRIDLNPPGYFSVELGLERDCDWILDIKRSLSNPGQVFVLTTTKLIWLEVADQDTYGMGEEVGTASVLLSWRHFRDIEDTTLTMSQLWSQNEISIILYSRMNRLAESFQFGSSLEDRTVPLATDPAIVQFPPTVDSSSSVPQSANIANFLSVIFWKVANTRVPHPEDNSRNVQLVKFVGLCADLSVTECLYLESVESGGETQDYRQANTITLRQERILSSIAVDDDDFIVDDPDEIAPSSAESKLPNALLMRDRNHFGRVFQWEVQHSLILAAFTDLLVPTPSRIKFGDLGHKFDSWLCHINDKLESWAGSNLVLPKCSTMLDILGYAPPLHDVEEDSQHLRTALQSNTFFGADAQRRCWLLALQLPASASHPSKVGKRAENIICMDAAVLYDSLVSDWISRLPHDIPNKVRALKEKLVRNIVPELVLSSVVIGREPNSRQTGMDNVETESELVPDGSSHAQDGGLPEFPQISQTGPVFNSMPHGNTESTSRLAESGEFTHLPLSALQSYTTLNKGVSASRQSDKFVSHWSVGADPSLYKWEASTATLEDEEPEEDHPAKIRRLERQKQREERKRARMSELVSSQPVAPQVPTVGFGGSQPSVVVSYKRDPRSSQIQEDNLPMTQIERGVFGGRSAPALPRPREKKKKRAGF